MARIAGIDLPREKRLETALTYIYGIGPTSAKKIVAEIGLSDTNPRVRELSEADSAKVREIVERDYRVEGDLRRGLPVRGQRTKTNARTRKGPRKTVGVKRKK
jgi:small subunit ribosomal protein S13